MKKFAKIMAVALVAVMALAVLVACGPNSDPDKAIAALKKNEYTAAKDTLIVPIALKGLGVNGVDCAVSGSKTVKDGDKSKLETVTIVYFADAAAAKDAFSKVEEYANDQNKDKDSDWTVKQSGAMIYWGTSAAIKAAR
ncbi:MAG: hypothetical protein J1F68_02605 [Clostridiales bacterium]|nr:hypothetical protein [Clostridiales bacterium]